MNDHGPVGIVLGGTLVFYTYLGFEQMPLVSD